MNRDEFAAWLEGQRYTAEKEGFSTLRPMILALEDADMILAALRTPDGDSDLGKHFGLSIAQAKEIDSTPFDDLPLSASRPVGEGWRPIKSAPRDGRLVILYSDGPGGVWLGYYGASRWYEHGMGGESYVEEDEVELWQPLPEPPRSHAEDEG